VRFFVSGKGNSAGPQANFKGKGTAGKKVPPKQNGKRRKPRGAKTSHLDAADDDPNAASPKDGGVKATRSDAKGPGKNDVRSSEYREESKVKGGKSPKSKNSDSKNHGGEAAKTKLGKLKRFFSGFLRDSSKWAPVVAVTAILSAMILPFGLSSWGSPSRSGVGPGVKKKKSSEVEEESSPTDSQIFRMGESPQGARRIPTAAADMAAQRTGRPGKQVTETEDPAAHTWTETQEAARRQAEMERAARQRAEMERAARQRAEMEGAARQRAEMEEAARQQAEMEEAARRQAEMEEARQQAEMEEARRQAEMEEAARQQAEMEEARQQAAMEEAARRQAEMEEARRQAEMEEAARQQAEIEAQERRARQEAEEQQREEAKRQHNERARAERAQKRNKQGETSGAGQHDTGGQSGDDTGGQREQAKPNMNDPREARARAAEAARKRFEEAGRQNGKKPSASEEEAWRQDAENRKEREQARDAEREHARDAEREHARDVKHLNPPVFRYPVTAKEKDEFKKFTKELPNSRVVMQQIVKDVNYVLGIQDREERRKLGDGLHIKYHPDKIPPKLDRVKQQKQSEPDFVFMDGDVDITLQLKEEDFTEPYKILIARYPRAAFK